jgi:hypothetical protein
MSAIAHSCAACGTDVPFGARFCASCGAPVGPAPPRPHTWAIAERRLFGVVPGATLAGAARTRAGRLWAVLRSRVRFMSTVVGARAGAELARLRLRLELRRLQRERERELHALGHAVYRDDAAQTARLREGVAALDARAAAVAAELEHVARVESERIARARAEGGATSVVEPLPPGAPEPPIVPEPEPVPNEPPGPVIVPEPEPVPHEPPGPVIVPEPDPQPPPRE